MQCFGTNIIREEQKNVKRKIKGKNTKKSPAIAGDLIIDICPSDRELLDDSHPNPVL
jgi:hypothetical protein